MANSSNYKVVLNAEINAASLQASIKAQSGKNIVVISAQIDPKFQSQFDAELAKIQAKAKSVNVIKFSETGNKAIIDYTNQLNQSVKATITLGKNLNVSETITKNLAKDARELAKAYQDAERFLAKASGMAPSQRLSAAIGTAQSIKTASLAGNIDEVRNLTSAFNVQKSALTSVAQGVRSWTAGMAQSLKTTIQYAASVGLLYGALNQIKQGVQYVKDLNKEMVNIQMVTGGTDAEITKLAQGYNQLGREMSVSTLDIARGSLEFVRQGKSAEETATLIRNSTMMSKLGNMEAAESSEALTSIMNGFKLEAEETGVVVDKLVSIKFVETHRNMWIET